MVFHNRGLLDSFEMFSNLINMSFEEVKNLEYIHTQFDHLKLEEEHRDIIVSNLIRRHRDRKNVITVMNFQFFNRSWLIPFDRRLTETKLFRVSPSNFVHVKIMTVKDNFRYIKSDNCKVVFLQYEQSELMAAIILPLNGKDVTKSLLRLTSGTLMQYYNDSETRQVLLKLPRFKISQNIDLRAALLKMKGSGLFKTHNQSVHLAQSNGFIDHLVQTTFLFVDEDGTWMNSKSSEEESKEGNNIINEVTEYNLFATHPFLFILFHPIKQMIISVTLIKDPTPDGVFPSSD
ncbi:Serpin I2 [Thelohanellus kitauei]|uniref:Serpin I2 n=1 Tax=Thelohanellus kitauei TaxID=669202 RepID=A0A0C2M7N7_THEKT|nr:Serpin I2 [Thelohanellus kitauei]